jgi:hypothetical protein
VFGNRKRFEERERTEQIGFELTSRSLYPRRPSPRRKTGKFIDSRTQ